MGIFLGLAVQIQEGQAAGFDVIPEYSMSWESRLFTLYLLFAFVIMLVKSLSLAWRLWFSAKRRPSLQKPGVIDAHSLAALALANRLSLDFSLHGRNNVSADFRAVLSLHALPQAERTFHYAWDSCRADIDILRRLVVLTLLSSSLMLAYGIATILTEISNQKLGVGVLSGSMA